MTAKVTRLLMFLLGLALIHSASGQTMYAQDNYRAKATKVTVTEPMQVPGTVLAPGDYIFRLNDSDANRHIVQIFDAKDDTKLITTILAIPNERLEPTPKGIMTYGERPSGQPVALEAWFYPGEKLGQQFVYPKTKAAELSKLNNTQVPSTGTEQAYPGEISTAPTTADNHATTNRPEPVLSASAQAPAPAATPRPAPVAAQTPTTPRPATTTNAAPATAQDANPAPTSTDTNSNAKLPRTASMLPLIALLGSLLVGVAVILRVVVRA